ncbi:Calx-beta domain-containing protein [Alsobacter sp. SYSU BS001988]
MTSASEITLYYQAILGRAPTSAEQRLWASLQAGGAIDSKGIVLALAASTEASEAPAEVARLYEAAFGRKPDAGGLNSWDDALRKGASLHDIAQGFVASAEFRDHYGVGASFDRAGFVTSLYHNVLNREPDAAGLKFWTQSSTAPADLLVAFSQSPEFVSRAAPEVLEFFLRAATGAEDYRGSIFTDAPLPPGAGGVGNIGAAITELYHEILQRDPTPAELALRSAQLSKGGFTLDDITTVIGASSEAQGGPSTVIRLYEAVFGRKPDAAGLDVWTDALRGGASLHDIAQGFANSAEFRDRYGVGSSFDVNAFVTELYHNVLNRAPDAAGLQFWTHSGLSVPDLVASFSQSAEFVDRAAPNILSFFHHIAAGTETYTGSLFGSAPAVVPGGTGGGGGAGGGGGGGGGGPVVPGPPTYSIAGAQTTVEGGTLSFTVTRDASTTAETVSYSLDGTATSGKDYTAPAGTVSFAAGELTKTITIDTLTDSLVEGPESVILTLTKASAGGTISATAASATGTITDPAAIPTYSIAGAQTAVEGGKLSFTVTRDASGTAETVSYSLDGTATSGKDYTAPAGTVSFAAGELTKTITIDTLTDSLVEGPESVILTLTKASAGGTISATAASATGTITDPAAIPTYSIAGAQTAVEGGTLSFTVTRDASGTAETVSYSLDGTATSGKDYTAPAGTVSFAAGELTKTITLDTLTDNLVESPESVILTLTDASAGGTISATAASATGTITDPAAIPTYSIAGAQTAVEGGTLSFTVTRDASTTAETVSYSLDGTATSGKDYTAPAGTVSFAAGELTKTITIDTLTDSLVEGPESVILTLTNASAGGTISATAASATGTITDPAAVPTYAVTGAPATTEGGTLSFTVTRDASTTAETVSYSLDGTATSGKDYTAPAGTVSFAAGELTKTITIDTLTDSLVEGPESVILTLTKASAGGTISATAASATGTITDPAAIPTYSIAGAQTAVEGGKLSFTVTRDASGTAETVSYSLDGTATSGKDYTAPAGTVSFAAGELTKTITLDTLTDNLVESPESVILTLTNASAGGTISATAASATGTITDPAAVPTYAVTGAPATTEGGTLSFTVTRDASGTAETVSYSLDGTATSGKDYTAPAGTVSFAAGELTKTITLDTLTDNLVESPESVILTLTNASAGGTINATAASATGTITDPVGAVYSVAGTPSAAEGGTLSFTVTRDLSASAETVTYSLGGLATAGADYTAPSGSVSFAAGEASKTVSISTLTDGLTEGPESVILTLMAANAGGTISAANMSATGTITDTFATVSGVTLNGSLADWTQADRLDTFGGGAAGYEFYGKSAGGNYVFALKGPAAIGPNTTLWLNTDEQAATGYKIFGANGGAEYNINFDAAGAPHLYTGGAGETLVPNAVVSYGFSADKQTVEFAVAWNQVSDPNGVAQVLADVNDAIFLPANYGTGGYTVSPVTTIGAVTLDGALTDWTAKDRLETAANSVAGVEVYGRYEGDSYIVALKSGAAIGAGTTAWLNTDRNAATGYQIFGNSGGAEYNVNFGADGSVNLYKDGAGQTLVATGLAHGYSADHTTVEFAIPKSDLAGAPSSVDFLFDLNDKTFLPTTYTSPPYTITDPASLPPPVTHALKVGIVYSDTSAAKYFSPTAYSDLFMAAQNQAAMAGVPFDLLSEADLKNADTLKTYSALVFPSFQNVKAADYAVITSALTTAVQSGVGLITANNFMSNDENGAALAASSANMNNLLGVTPVGYDSVTTDTVRAADGAGPVIGYAANELIQTYSANTAGKVGTAYYAPVDPSKAQIVATQSVVGHTAATLPDGTYNAILATQTSATGAKNVVFSTESILADHNLLSNAIDYVVQQQRAGAPELSLHISRSSSILATRVDMDQAQEAADVNPPNNAPGIYDAFVPLMQQWKQAYNFNGSYYFDIGANPNQGEFTDWTVSLPYYRALMALGGEIGSHTITHPEDTNLLTAAQIASEFQGSKTQIESHLGSIITGVAVPGAPETLATDHLIFANSTYNYLTGRYTGIGADYPSAFGYLTTAATDRQHVYLAPNMKSDFSLVEAAPEFGGGLSPAQALTEWKAEYDALRLHSDLPVVLWTWHDYGAALWPTNAPKPSPYTQAMYTDFVAYAAQNGSEFVTVADLAARVASSEQASLDYAYDAANGVLTATASPGGGDLGKFALDLNPGQQIASVTGWYAYDNDSVFLPTSGGSYEIHLLTGGAAANVTHITALPARAELASVTGDGTNLQFAVTGDGTVSIDLADVAGKHVAVTGANIVAQNGEQLTLGLAGLGQHSVSVTLVAGAAPSTAAVAATTAAPDSFVFNSTIGKTVISGFEPGSLPTHDTLDFATSLFADANAVLAAATQVGNDVVISHGADESITLSGVLKSALVSADFMFHSG